VSRKNQRCFVSNPPQASTFARPSISLRNHCDTNGRPSNTTLPTSNSRTWTLKTREVYASPSRESWRVRLKLLPRSGKPRPPRERVLIDRSPTLALERHLNEKMHLLIANRSFKLSSLAPLSYLRSQRLAKLVSPHLFPIMPLIRLQIAICLRNYPSGVKVRLQ
jgi:hypothetical protein